MKWYGKYVGIPFRSLGRTKFGCDCYGLVKLVLQEHYNLSLPDIKDYANALDSENIAKLVDVNVPLLAGEKLDYFEEGAVVILESSKGFESHIGILVTDVLVLHTTERTGALIVTVDSKYIKERIKGVYRVDKSYSTDRSI